MAKGAYISTGGGKCATGTGNKIVQGAGKLAVTLVVNDKMK